MADDCQSDPLALAVSWIERNRKQNRRSVARLYQHVCWLRSLLVFLWGPEATMAFESSGTQPAFDISMAAVISAFFRRRHFTSRGIL